MTIIPQVKECKLGAGYCAADAFVWQLQGAVDERVVNAAKRICDAGKGTPVLVSHDSGDGEGYTLTVCENEIKLHGTGAAGAFYGLATLKMLAKSGKGRIECCEITDAPDMPYRGFYQDTTRGRIPTLDTLKKLVDTMADYKMNSLQLYVEHSYPFREYAFCCDQLGYLTKEEIQALDIYCKERFIELVPSLSCFGHLYHLLQSEQYKHLCELKDYTPSKHYYMERMRHHTINPLMEESFALVTSLIDQHMSAFSSDKFNICCDETFDLGSDVNKEHDKGELYVGFVKKLVAYLESKGKRVMMWGDVALQHPERLPEFPDDITFLNWYYHVKEDEKRFAAMADKKQIVCPGTSTWLGFHEVTTIEEGNITMLARYGKKYGAEGVLNTNWGDLGNPASIDMAIYGLILGAAASWDNDTEVTPEFKQFISDYHYGCSDALKILTKLSEATANKHWLYYQWDRLPQFTAEELQAAQDAVKQQIKAIEAASFADDDMKQEFLIAAKGDSLVLQWVAAKQGHTVVSDVDFDAWIAEYKQNWLDDSKQGELDELVSLFAKEQNESKQKA